MTDAAGQGRWLPPRLFTEGGQERRVGIELEMAGIDPQAIVRCIQAVFGGDLERLNRFEYRVIDSVFGKFVVELDANSIKAIGDHLEKNPAEGIEGALQNAAGDLLTSAAQALVPWEVATPPIPFSKLDQVAILFDALRNAGARGTRSSMVYAFGLHLNPELPAFDVDTLLRYLRAFLCLFEWITAHDETDVTRRLSGYIEHFGKPYILKVIDPSYKPDLKQFMLDYLEFNPTRNRTLDFLPLFAWLDEALLREHVTDIRVKARPTLHYRLPNCDIDNPQWNIDWPWRDWLLVERLADKPEIVTTMCQEYRPYLDSITLGLEGGWKKTVERWWGGF